MLELSAIQQAIRERGDEVFEMIESTMWESALRTLKSLTNELEVTNAQIERDDKLDKSKQEQPYLNFFLFVILTRSFLVVTKVAPWIQRASDIKAEVVVNHELEHKLQQHNEEIIKLIKDVRLKVLLHSNTDSLVFNSIIINTYDRTKHFKNLMLKSVCLKREWK